MHIMRLIRHEVMILNDADLKLEEWREHHIIMQFVRRFEEISSVQFYINKIKLTELGTCLHLRGPSFILFEISPKEL